MAGHRDVASSGTSRLCAAESLEDRTLLSNVPFVEMTIDGSVEGAISVTTADVDGDGDLDVLGADSSANDVLWWENTAGDGSAFTEHTIETDFDGAFSVSAADIDGDGDLDVLGAARYADDITWWENTAGDGSAFTEHTIDGNFDGATSVTAADVDGDGDLDVLGAARDADDIAWWENTAGDGSAFTEHTIDGNFDGAYSVTAADLDADGDLDVLGAAFFGSDLTWWENTAGDGSAFTERTIDSFFNGAISVSAGDVDGDGHVDVLGAALTADDITWWANRSIHRTIEYPDPDTATLIDDEFQPRDLDLVDIDGDGDLDLVATRYGASGVTLKHWINGNGQGATWAPTDLSAIPRMRSVDAGDLDRDGRVDFLTAASINDTGRNDLAWWRQGDFGFFSHRLIDGEADRVRSAELADIDGDGDLDAVAGGDRTRWWENTAGDGSAWTKRTIDSQFSYGIAVADVDGDGDLDVVGGEYSTTDLVWWSNNNGAGTSWTQRTITGVGTGKHVRAVDMDGDGDLDVIRTTVSPGADSLRWYRNNNGGGTSWTEFAVDTTEDYGSLDVVDLDHDGDYDIVAGLVEKIGGQKSNALVRWWENTAGDGSAWTDHTVDEFPGIELGVFNPAVAAVGDIDGDGDYDIAAGEDQSGSDHDLVWYRQDNHQFSLATTDTAPVTIADGTLNDVLRIDVAHLGRAGDEAVELATLELLFEENPGDPLTSAEANAIIDSVQIFRDSGDGRFGQGADTHLTTVGLLTLVNGVETIVLPDGNANTLAAHGGTGVFFVVIETTNNASAQTPAQFQVTHITEASSTAENPLNDSLLTLKPADNVSSSPVNPDPPGAPTFTNPQGVINDPTPQFQWTVPTGQVSTYDLLVYDAISGGEEINFSGITNPFYDVPGGSPLDEGGYYQAFVRAVNGQGEAGPYSIPEYFSIDPPVLPSQVPTFTGPVANITDDTPTITWQEAGRATAYELDVFNTGTGQLVIDQNNITNTFFTPAAALPDATYQAFVRSKNGTVVSANSAPIVFTIGPGGANTVPSWTGPIDSIEDLSPILTWTDVADVHFFEVLLYSVDRGALVRASSSFIPQYTPQETLLPSETYQAFVRARTNAGAYTDYSAAIEFAYNVLDLRPPDVNVRLLPTTNDTTPPFIWDDIIEAERYELRVFHVNTGQQVIHEQNLTQRSFNPAAALALGTYQVFCRMFDAQGFAGSYKLPVTFDIVGWPLPQTAPFGPGDAVDVRVAPANGPGDGDVGPGHVAAAIAPQAGAARSVDVEHSATPTDCGPEDLSAIDAILTNWPQAEWWDDSAARNGGILQPQETSLAPPLLAAGVVAAWGTRRSRNYRHGYRVSLRQSNR